MEIPLRTAYGQAGRCDMQPKAKYSLRAQAQLMRTETVETVELVKDYYGCSDVVQSGRPIFDGFFQHLWPYIANNTANVVFQMVKRLWLIRIDQ
ncbi:hypothetical protein TNCV_4338821 [Trichonephila clavipes]|nr:hypothetical protein TNCV_4338821 [Trichonephila clavipes]